jgi:hypothetical protein
MILMEKRGQFYLVAAIIITVIVMGIAAISNYSIKSEPTNVEALKEQIQTESTKTIDYGINKPLDQNGMFNLLTDFTQQYINSESRDKNLYFIFGTKTNMTLNGFQNTNNNVLLDNAAVTSNSNSAFLYSEVPANPNLVILTINQTDYDFNLSDGQNFFFVISQQTGGETDVVSW